MSTLGKLGGAIRRRFAGSEAGPQVRRFRPGVEGLEGRALLSKGLTEFPIVTPGSSVDSIDAMTRGPDGNIWFTVETSEGAPTVFGEAVGKMTPTGQVTTYPISGSYIPTPGDPFQITSGPDGNLWFTTGVGVGKITPAGAVTLFPAPAPYSRAAGPGANVSFTGLTAGPDGNVWFTGATSDPMRTVFGEAVSKITPTGQVTTYAVPAEIGSVGAITRGRDGQLWFLASTTKNTIFESVTTSGQFTSHAIVPNSRRYPAADYAISTGPDGNPWVIVDSAISNEIYRHSIFQINPSGKSTKFPVPLAGNRWFGAIAAGPGHGLSFTVTDVNFDTGPVPQPTVGRIAANGRVTFIPLPKQQSDAASGKFTLTPSALATGSDGNLWMAVNDDYHSPSNVAIVRLNTRGGKHSSR